MHPTLTAIMVLTTERDWEKVICPWAIEVVVDVDVAGAAREVDRWAPTTAGGCFVLSGRWPIEAERKREEVAGIRAESKVSNHRRGEGVFDTYRSVGRGEEEGQGGEGRRSCFPPSLARASRARQGCRTVPSRIGERE